MTVKERVLGLLEAHRGVFVSGGQFASAAGVSRTAVWKAVSALREDGYPIEAVTNKGYRLSAESSRLSLAGMAPYFDGSDYNLQNTQDTQDTQNIIIRRSIDSTNNEAKRMIADAPGAAPYGTVIIAGEQTAGRGRRGRAFVSPAADSVYMSFILKPAVKAGPPFLVTIMAAVCVCEAIEEVCGAQSPYAQTPLIKWVNDVFLDGRKICGILTEAVSDVESGGIESIVLGIGININVPEDAFPEDIREIAGSLRLDPGDRNRFAAALVRHVRAAYAKLSEGISPIAAYRSRSLVTGHEITVLGANARKATAREILDNGSLLVEYADGSTEVLVSGEVSVRL
ncbi:MAG: biotin--[acetyl-CoA-carboxylase] ligase [Clostridiales Family XIII bacterium]|jgi:BirA family biotin operon repressor/biotin-[acetyl-CoA-carboxylase] ligase|nr:biotin--[acetyl-CoA-carboxylase] ligase [Clostridiales Family XIII bacterium]